MKDRWAVVRPYVADAPLHVQRLAHALHRRGHRRLARALTYALSLIFSAILPPEAELPGNTRFHHHALGVVLHPCVRLGQRVSIQHHVTLGTDVANDSGLYMDVGDEVEIGAHAVLLGPIKVGARAKIGAGAVVTRDVPAGTTVGGVPARPLSSSNADD